MLIVWVKLAEEVLLLVSPLYIAVTGLAPSDRLEVDTVATPLATGTVPSFVAPLENATVPVALVGTDAVNVTGEFELDLVDLSECGSALRERIAAEGKLL